MDKVKFLRFLTEIRANRISMEKQEQEGYFKSYPERKQIFMDSYKDSIKRFVENNPEAITILESIKIKAQEKLKKRNFVNAKKFGSDEFILSDVEFALTNCEPTTQPNGLLDINDDNYEIIKILCEARCSAYRGGILAGSKNLDYLLKNNSAEVLQNALQIAKEVGEVEFPERTIARDLELAIFSAGVSEKVNRSKN